MRKSIGWRAGARISTTALPRSVRPTLTSCGVGLVAYLVALPLLAQQPPAGAPGSGPEEGANQPPPAPGEPAQPVPPPPAVAPSSASATGASTDSSADAADPLASRFDRVLARPGGLTSDQVAQRARETSWAIRSKDKDIEAAEYDVDRAKAAYYPELKLIARYTRLSPVEQGSFGGGGGVDGALVVAQDLPAGATYPGDYPGFTGLPFSALTSGFDFPVFLDQYWFQAALSVPISDYVFRAGHGLSAARNNRKLARLNAQAARLQDASNARLAYYDWVRAKLQLVVAEQALAQSREHVRVTEATFAGGRLSRADVLRAQSLAASNELLVTQARHFVTLAEDRLRTLMHDQEPGSYEVGEDVRQLPSTDSTTTFQRLYAEALQNRLELQALDSARRSLHDAEKAVRADNYPRFAAFANGYVVNPSNRVIPQEDKFRAQWDVGVELTWTPTRIASAQAEASKYRVQAQQRELDIQTLRDALRTEVMQAHQATLEARVNIETATRGLEAAEEGYRVRQKLFRYGRATSVEVTDAETDLLRARLALVNAEVDVHTARVRLEHAVGRDAASLTKE